MNDTNIETTNKTWNPVVGCKRGCHYCYAQFIAKRLYGSFEPQLFENRLIEPCRDLAPSVVFVVNMGDLWGDWVEAMWIKLVLAACRKASWHTYQFYTKDPRRYSEFLSELPPRSWLGCTIDEGFDVNTHGKRSNTLPNAERIELLNRVDYPRKFVSIEPFDPTKLDFYLQHVPKMKVQWAHIGFRTWAGGRVGELAQSAFDAAAKVCALFDKEAIPVWPKSSIADNDLDSWPGKWKASIPEGIELKIPPR